MCQRQCLCPELFLYMVKGTASQNSLIYSLYVFTEIPRCELKNVIKQTNVSLDLRISEKSKLKSQTFLDV